MLAVISVVTSRGSHRFVPTVDLVVAVLHFSKYTHLKFGQFSNHMSQDKNPLTVNQILVV